MIREAYNRLYRLRGIVFLGLCLAFCGMGQAQECVVNVTVDYLDSENNIILELYMEPLSKFLALPPESATDPVRIRADAANTQEIPANRTLVLRTGLVLPAPSGIQTILIPCNSIPDPSGVLVNTPYVILGVYTDSVVEGDGPRLFGAASPGTFVFSEADIQISLELQSQEVTAGVGEPSPEELDITWAAAAFVGDSNLLLYFDRDNTLDILAPDGTYLRTIVADEIDSASVVLAGGEQISNNGVAGLDYGLIDLSGDVRFPPPPPTGHINPTTYPSAAFRWDYGDFPAGRLYVYGVLTSGDGTRVIDYAPGSSQATEQRWPVFIGTGVDDRFVHGVAIHDIVQSASELDVVAVAQSGLFRIFDYLGRTWGSYTFDLNVTIDTAPACGDIDNDGEVEIVLGTDQLISDENPIFRNQNAVIVVDSQFKGRYEALSSAVMALVSPSQAVIESLIAQYSLTNSIYFIPAGQGVFATPTIRDIDGDNKKEVLIVTRPLTSNGSSVIRVLSFSPNPAIAPIVEASINPAAGTGYLGEPAAGNLVGEKSSLEVALGSESGKIYVFNPYAGAIGAPVLTLSGPTLRPPALVDSDGDGLEEILIAISQRDRASSTRTELHYLKGDGSPVTPFTKTRIFRPSLVYDSLSTPVVSRLFPTDAVPAGYSNDLLALFVTRNTFTGINLAKADSITGDGLQVFNFAPGGVDYYFGSSSPIVGQVDPARASFEIVLGGGRDSHGNLHGWSFVNSGSTSGSLIDAAGFGNHVEPVLEGEYYASSILGSPEMADLDGNGQMDIIYTNERGYINRLEAPASFGRKFLPAEFPWPSYKHDVTRTGSASGTVAPFEPFLAGDINRDGVVDENDLFSVSKSWGEPGAFVLRSGALAPQSQADYGTTMEPPRYLLRVLEDMRR